MQYFFSPESRQVITVEIGEHYIAYLYDDLMAFVMEEPTLHRFVNRRANVRYYDFSPLTEDDSSWRELSLVEVEYIRVKLTTSKRSPVGKDVREACKDELW